MKLSCFSAVALVMGWNQWVKWAAPFPTAHSFMSFATSRSRCVPYDIVFFRVKCLLADESALPIR